MRERTIATTLCALATILLIAGCGSDPDQRPGAEGDPVSPTPRSTTVAADQACPLRLAKASADTLGFGTDEPATSVPALPSPEAGWVCQYWPLDGAADQNGDTSIIWTRSAAPRQVVPADLAKLTDGLRGLKTVDRGLMCTADLGHRYVLAYTHDDDRTAVVADNFGCGSVRLTEDPANVVSGESHASRLVTGVLSAPAEFHRLLEQLAGPPKSLLDAETDDAG